VRALTGGQFCTTSAMPSAPTVTSIPIGVRR